MPSENTLLDFVNHHKNRFNITFHVVCGLIYTSLLLSMIGGVYAIWVYILFLVAYYPKMTLVWALSGVFMHQIAVACSTMSLMWKGMAVFIVYMLPELGHVLAKEKTVIGLHNITLTTVIENVFMLLPYSIIALANLE